MPRLWAAKGCSIGTRRLQPMLLNVELAPFFVFKGSFLRSSTCWTHKEQNGDFGGLVVQLLAVRCIAPVNDYWRKWAALSHFTKVLQDPRLISHMKALGHGRLLTYARQKQNVPFVRKDNKPLGHCSATLIIAVLW